MKKSFYSLLIASVMTFGALCAQGAEATAQAIVLAVKGPVSAASAGAKAAPIKVGDKLPEGALITSGAGGEADIQVFNGAVATIRPDTTVALEKLSVTASGGVVTKQTALLNLKVGKIASNIDPANKKINDYGIRTPKGVAAARGTAYLVSVSADGGTAVFVTDSQVSFTVTTTVNGVTKTETVTVPAGSKVTVASTGTYTTTTATTAEIAAAKEENKPLEKGSTTTTTTTTTDDTTKTETKTETQVIIIDPSPSS